MKTPFFIPRVLIGGREIDGPPERESLNLWNGSVVGRFGLCGPDHLNAAVGHAVEGAKKVRTLAAFERSAVLQRVAELLRERSTYLAELIVAEVGKPITFARTEVDRAIATFTIASEEAKRIGGEVLPLDLNEASRGRTGLVRRFPVGVIVGISPFNFPLNLVAHKLAPAIASGNAFLLKPASSAPLPALALGQMIVEAGYPADAVNIVPSSGAHAQKLVEDPRVGMVTFTGSAAVGWGLKARAGRKKVVLELGGNAGVIVDSTADVEDAVSRLAIAAFAYAGQVCIKTQRIYVHEAVYDAFAGSFSAKADSLPVGDPMDEKTVVGPMIDEENAVRVEQWIEEAVRGGASVLTSRTRHDRVIPPTVIEGASRDAKVVCEEVFGPVVTLHRFAGFSDALQAVNDSSFGLQAGVFTNNLSHAWQAFETLEVGGVIINDTSSYRIDHMPYGGIKASGCGREGVRYAIESMTEPRFLALRT